MGKISSSDLFNVGIGSYNGAEICNMVRFFLLNEIKTTKLFKNGECGIFRDDRLAVIQSNIPRSAEITSKSFRKIFARWGFKITVETGLKQIDFLDIELNLNTKKHFPCFQIKFHNFI